jgi:hypothetical protein
MIHDVFPKQIFKKVVFQFPTFNHQRVTLSASGERILVAELVPDGILRSSWDRPSDRNSDPSLNMTI